MSGVQAIFTKQRSNAAQSADLSSARIANGSPNGSALAQRKTISVDYVDVLPSRQSVAADLRRTISFSGLWRCARDHPAAAGRHEERSVPTIGYNIQDPDGAGPQQGLATVTGELGKSLPPAMARKRLRPHDGKVFRGKAAIVAVQLFYKDLKSYIYTASTPVPIELARALTRAGIDAQVPRISDRADRASSTSPINGKGGSISTAVELAGDAAAFRQDRRPCSTVSGITGGGSYTKSKIKTVAWRTNQRTTCPAIRSGWSNGTPPSSRNGASIRAWQRPLPVELSSARFQALRRTGSAAARRRRRSSMRRWVMTFAKRHDARMACRSIVQGQNLTDEPFRTAFNRSTSAEPRHRLSRSYGRRFLAGASVQVLNGPASPPTSVRPERSRRARTTHVLRLRSARTV